MDLKAIVVALLISYNICHGIRRRIKPKPTKDDWKFCPETRTMPGQWCKRDYRQEPACITQGGLYCKYPCNLDNCRASPPRYSRICPFWECSVSQLPPEKYGLISPKQVRPKESFGSSFFLPPSYEALVQSKPNSLSCSTPDFKTSFIITKDNFLVVSLNYFKIQSFEMKGMIKTLNELIEHTGVNNSYSKGKKRRPPNPENEKDQSTPMTAYSSLKVKKSTPFPTRSTIHATTTLIATPTTTKIRTTSTSTTKIRTTSTSTTKIRTTSTSTTKTTVTIPTTSNTSKETLAATTSSYTRTTLITTAATTLYISTETLAATTISLTENFEPGNDDETNKKNGSLNTTVICIILLINLYLLCYV